MDSLVPVPTCQTNCVTSHISLRGPLDMQEALSGTIGTGINNIRLDTIRPFGWSMIDW